MTDLVPRSVEIDAVGARIALRSWSPAEPSRPPVLLLPATGETATDWDVIAADLARDRTVHAMDLRGHGDSDWPGDYAMSRFVADVLGVLSQLGAAPVDLIGHSLGGLVATLVAGRRPPALRRLVLEDVSVPYPRRPNPPDRPDGPLAFDWRIVTQVRPQLDDPDPAWVATMAAIVVPTLVIGGGTASPVRQDRVAALAELLPDARLVTIEAGHLIHATRPEEYLAAVRPFLDG